MGSSLIKPNKKEAEEVTNINLDSDIDFEKAGISICKNFKIKACLITRGSDGMSYISNKLIFHLKSQAKEIFDVSGAGDTVISVLALGLMNDMEEKEAVKLANEAAGIVVGHVGTTAIQSYEL